MQPREVLSGPIRIIEKFPAATHVSNRDGALAGGAELIGPAMTVAPPVFSQNVMPALRSNANRCSSVGVPTSKITQKCII